MQWFNSKTKNEEVQGNRQERRVSLDKKGQCCFFSILFWTMFFSREMTTALNIKQGQKDCYHLLLCLVNDVCPCNKVTQRGGKRCRSRSSSQIRDWARSGLGWVRDSNLELTREGRGWAGGRRRVAGCTRAPQLVMAKGHWLEVQAADRKGQKADSGDQSGIFFSCHWQWLFRLLFPTYTTYTKY